MNKKESQKPATLNNHCHCASPTRQAHNLKVVGSNPTPATKYNVIKSIIYKITASLLGGLFLCLGDKRVTNCFLLMTARQAKCLTILSL